MGQYSIYTRIYKDNGEPFINDPNTDFITALNYIRANELQDVEFLPDEEDPGRARMIFTGTDRKRLTVVADITRREEIGEAKRDYDIQTRIFWDNEEVAKGQDVDFIDLLGYIKFNCYDILERPRGNLASIEMTFYSNMGKKVNRRNRIEATVTAME